MLKGSSDLILLFPSVTPQCCVCTQSPNYISLCITVQNARHISGLAGEPKEQTQDSGQENNVLVETKMKVEVMSVD